MPTMSQVLEHTMEGEKHGPCPSRAYPALPELTWSYIPLSDQTNSLKKNPARL